MSGSVTDTVIVPVNLLPVGLIDQHLAWLTALRTHLRHLSAAQPHVHVPTHVQLCLHLQQLPPTTARHDSSSSSSKLHNRSGTYTRACPCVVTGRLSTVTHNDMGYASAFNYDKQLPVSIRSLGLTVYETRQQLQTCNFHNCCCNLHADQNVPACCDQHSTARCYMS